MHMVLLGSVLLWLYNEFLQNSYDLFTNILQGCFTGTGTIISGLILGLHPANERRRYKVTPSLIGWVQT